MKHAVLILGHGDLSILEKTLTILDSPQIDFYIHIDLKSSDDGTWLENCCKQSRCFFSERCAVYWGHYSLTLAGAILLRMATTNGIQYDYYHLISGVDMPLMTPDDLDAFFVKNNGTEFVRFFGGANQGTENNWRMQYRYPLLTFYRRNKSNLICNLQKLLFSRIIRFPRKKGTSLVRDKGWTVYAGDQWWSITDGLAKEFVRKEQEMMPYWLDCYVADETYACTLLKYSPQFMKNQSQFPTREIDWGRGKPYVWQVQDFDTLINSSAVFARKFDPNRIEIANMLQNHLMARKRQQETEI